MSHPYQRRKDKKRKSEVRILRIRCEHCHVVVTKHVTRESKPPLKVACHFCHHTTLARTIPFDDLPREH